MYSVPTQGVNKSGSIPTPVTRINLEEIESVFSEYDFLGIKKVSPSDFSLKIDRLKFVGPLGQANSLKIDIDLTQELIRPLQKIAYHNVYGVDVRVTAMDLAEICAEKLRAANERARYRDFYDLTMAFEKRQVGPLEIVEILKKKELRKPLRSENVLENLKIAQDAKDRGFENLYYQEEITKNDVEGTLSKLLPLLE
jgi:hypothetical protein